MSNLRWYSNLSVENKQLHNKCDYVEQPSRNGLARFSFVPHRIGESTTTKVVDIINQIWVTVSQCMYYADVSHRTGKLETKRPN
jgi:hypothetical protein